MIKRELELHRFNTHSENRVQMAAGRLSNIAFKHGGQLGTHLIIGGVDCKGPQLIEVSNDGNMYSFPYLTMGSGCLAAMGVMETGFTENMEENAARDLVVASIEAGVYHDLGSGSNVDYCIIKKGKVDYVRNYKTDNKKIFAKPGGYTFPKERVQVLNEYKQKLVVEEGAQPMDLS